MEGLLATLQSGNKIVAPKDYLAQLAKAESLNLKSLKAIVTVETGGKSAFDDKGRPKFLFEPHHFYKLLPKSMRNDAVAANLARTKFEQAYYNKFERTFDSRWKLLSKAADFHDVETAVGACSWGPAQIVGHLWARKCGYANSAEFVRASVDEKAMFDAFVKVLLAMKLRDAINSADFRKVARTYNGPANVEVYAPKMQKAYLSFT